MKPREQLLFFDDAEKEKRKITLSLDKIYIIGVFFLITLIVCFGLGVEKGKRLKLAGLNTQLIDNQDITQNTSQSEVSGPETALPMNTAPIEKGPEATPQEEKTRQLLEKKGDIESAFYYSIQVASYKNAAAARTEAEKLEKKGVGPVIIKPGNKWTALCVGRFKSISEAQKLAKSLKVRYSDCYVRKL